MTKKGVLLLSSLIVLSACDTPDEVSEIEVEETTVDEEEREVDVPEIEEESEVDVDRIEQVDDAEENDGESTQHIFTNLVDAETFSNEHGYGAWEEYQTILNQVTISELLLEGDLNGSSSAEVDDMVYEGTNEEELVKDVVDVTETEQMVIYRYPADEEMSEMADYLAEITFYFFEDHLIFTAITPGFYSVDLDGLPSTDELSQLMTVSEVEALDSKVFTVAEMVVFDEAMHQTMVPAMGVDEEGNEVISAFYFFTRGEDIIQFAHLPFDQPSLDFPTYSLLLYQEIIANLEEI